MNAWALLIVIYAAVFISSPLIAVFHELGHALAYLLFTKPDKIDIYIGSYGERKNTIQFSLGRLHFFIKRSFPFVKGIGLCSSSKPEIDYKKYIVILIAGAVFTLITAGIIAAMVFTIQANLLVQIFCYIFLGFSFFSLLTNLIPRHIQTTTGMGLESDGNQMLFTVKIKTALVDYIAARESLGNKDFDNAVIKFRNVLAAIPGDAKMLRFLIYILIQQKKYTEASSYLIELEKKHELLPNDLLNKGCIQSFTKQHDEAITTYQKLLKKERNNLRALNNIAYELIEKGAFIVAQRAIDRALKIDPDFYYVNNTMAYSKILQGDFEGAKTILDKCLKMNIEPIFVYKTLGIYYLKLNDTEKASEYFNKAIEIDKDTDLGVYADELKEIERSAPV